MSPVNELATIVLGAIYGMGIFYGGWFVLALLIIVWAWLSDPDGLVYRSISTVWYPIRAMSGLVWRAAYAVLFNDWTVGLLISSFLLALAMGVK